MKEMLQKNIGMKLLSLALAFLLWIAVINSQDPLETVKFENVPVTVLNEESLTAKDKIPEIVEGDTVTVTVQARHSVCEKLTAEDIVAVADLEKISLTDAVPIEVSVEGYSDREVEIVRGFNQVLKLELEDMETREFRLKVTTSGAPLSGYVVGDLTASPNMISVSGSKTQIGKIKEIVLNVDVSGISGDVAATAVPVVYDGNGDIVSASKLTLSRDSVHVKVSVLQTKEVSVRLYTSGEPAEGYEVSSVSFQPEKITVAGTEEDLRKLGNMIMIPYPIDGTSTTQEDSLEVSDYWDSSLKSLRAVDEGTIAVTVYIEEMAAAELPLQESDVSVRGCPAGMTAVIESLSASGVAVRGKSVRLPLLTVERLTPYIDVSDYTEPGVYELPLQYVNPMKFLIEGGLYATVRLETAPEEDGAPLSGGIE